MTPSTYHGQIATRATPVIDAIISRGSRSMWDAHALLARGIGQDQILAAVKRELSAESDTDRPLKGGPFHILSAMHLLCRWEHDLPEKAIALIRRLMTHGILERGNTENHWLMYYTGNLLAAERWPDMAVSWNGRPPEAIRAEATRWILGIIERTAANGHHEYDSTGYHTEHVIPYIALADHAQDPHLRRQAEQMLSLLVADMALEYLHGAWAGGHSREGYRENTWTRIGPVRLLHYLYFGEEDFDPAHHLQPYAVPALTARYRPPALFADIARDRQRAFVVKKTKAPRTIYRHVDRQADPVRKYTYMSKSFALGSTQIGLPGPPAGPIDLVSWDLTWDGLKHEAKIVCNHPYRSPGRFSAFLCSLPQTAGRAIATDKPYLQYPDRLFGASPYERMMQHQGTVIVLYKIPADDDAPYVNLYLPRSIAWEEQNGWLFGNLESFYVALRPIGPCRWHQIRESGYASVLVRDGDLIDGWLLRIEDLSAGLILEAVEANDAGSFDAFRKRRTDAHLDLSGWPDRDRVIVNTSSGVRLDMGYDGPHSVDGQPIDYDAYPLYEAPWVDAPLGTGRMTFHYEDAKLDLDFGIDPQKPLLPMRVIG